MAKDLDKSKTNLARVEKAIAERALGYPEVVEEAPWGHRAFKIRGKTFLFLGAEAGSLSFSLKLPVSGEAALGLNFTEPTHYGLGKSGWVTSSFSADDDVPLPLVEAWVDESFRAIAPKKVVASLPLVAAPKKESAAGRAKKSVATTAKQGAAAPVRKPVAAAAKTGKGAAAATARASASARPTTPAGARAKARASGLPGDTAKPTPARSRASKKSSSR